MSEMWQNSHIYHSGNSADCSKGSFQQMAGFGLLTDIWTYYTLSFKFLILICSHQRSIPSPQPTLPNTSSLLLSETCNMLPTLFLMLRINGSSRLHLVKWSILFQGLMAGATNQRKPKQHSFFFSVPFNTSRTCIPFLYLPFWDRSHSAGMMGRVEMEEVLC